MHYHLLYKISKELVKKQVVEYAWTEKGEERLNQSEKATHYNVIRSWESATNYGIRQMNEYKNANSCSYR